MAELFKGMAGSPITYLMSNITASQKSITVADDTVLPDAPNICTIGVGENIETIRYGTKQNNVLGDVTRGIEGAPRAWQAGAEVARFFTAYDHNEIIETLSTHLAESANKHIHSSGVDGNKHWVKYDDGRMECGIIGIPLTKMSNYYLEAVFHFPQEFANNNINVGATCSQEKSYPLGRLYSTNKTKKTVSLRYFSPDAKFTSENYSILFDVVAKGYWK